MRELLTGEVVQALLDLGHAVVLCLMEVLS